MLFALYSNAQNKYLKFETSTGAPYTSGGGVSTYIYPEGSGRTGFQGRGLNAESLKYYGISPNFFLPVGVNQSSSSAYQTVGGTIHNAKIEDLYDGNYTTGASTRAIDDIRHITIDLGQNTTFNSVQVAALIAANLNGAALQTSSDGVVWTTVVNAANGLPMNAISGTTISSLTQLSFYTVTARYVRFVRSSGALDLSEFRLLPIISQSSGTVIGTPINLYDNAIAAAATTLATTAGQWVMQDLGCNRSFSAVKLSAVTVANLNGAELQVSTDGSIWTTLTTTNSATGVSGATISGISAVYPITFTFASQNARYVRVFKATAAIVETNEFQVGPELAASSATTLALYGTKALINNGTYTDGFTTTNTAGITQWVMVNLGAAKTFSHVQLGTNATHSNLAGSTIQTSTDGVTWINQLTNIAAPTASKLYTYYFPNQVTAQYVRVIRPTAGTTLGLSEFIVSPAVTLSSEAAKPAIANYSGLYDNAIAATATTISAANQFVMVDLGENKSFANVQISAGTSVANLDGALLQVSTDAINWTNLSFKNNATGVVGTTFSGSSIVYPITYTFSAQNARYVRIFRNAIGVISIGEFRVGAAVFQSSATTLANNAIPTLFQDTTFSTGALTTVVAGENQFVGLNFGSPQEFNNVIVAPHTAIVNLNGAALQISNDGENWTTITNIKDATSNTISNEISNAVLNTARIYSFATQTAQYIRLIKLDGSVLGVSEFKVSPSTGQSTGTSLGTPENLNDNSVGAAAVTLSGTGQWVMVDLETIKNVNFVKMATSGAVTNMDGALLQASTDGINWTSLTTKNSRTGVTGPTLTGSSISVAAIYSFATTPARYLRVFRASTGIVAVSEFQVSTGVYQSSGTTYASTTNLYDGITATAAGTTLAGTITSPAYVGVNLGASKTFSKIEIASTNVAQLNGATLEYSNDFATWTTLVTPIASIIVNQSNTLSFPAVTARYVRVRSTNSILTVSEFKVVESTSDVSVKLINPGLTNNVSVVTPIDFSFNFKGVNYTTFSVSTEGLLRLGSVVVTNESLNNTVSIANNPILYAQWNDLALGNAASNGGVTKTITGTAPNRKMIVEWRAVNGTATGITNLIYQIVLHETTNKIEYIYVSGADNTTDASIGMAVGTVADVTRLFYSVTPNATLANTTYSNMKPNDLVKLWPGNGTIYSFTPLDLPTTAVVPTDFKTLDNAMGAVNWAGTPNTGGYAITINGGHTEKAANAYATTPTGTTWVKVAGLLLQASGTAAKPIAFNWSGSGAKPIITNGDGVGGIDYIIGLAGADYVTFNGLELQDTTPHTSAFTAAQHTAANNLHAEIGFGLFKKRYNSTSGNDGCKFVTIKNFTIDLTRWPNGSTNYAFNDLYATYYCLSKKSWSRGIFATRYTAIGTGENPTYYPFYAANRTTGIKTQTDVHDNCNVVGNTINDVSIGVEWDDSWIKSGANFFAGTNNIIGKIGEGNTITNWGPQPAASNATAYNYISSNRYSASTYIGGIIIGGQKDYTVSYNTISNAVNESGTTTTPLTATSNIQNYAGIVVGRSGMNQDYPQQAPGFFKKINNNTISNIDVTTTTTNNTASVYGIVDMATYSPNVPNTNLANASNGNVEINNNTIFNLKSRSGNVRGISTRMILRTANNFYTTLGSNNYEYDYFNTNGTVSVKNNTIKQLAQLGNNTYNNATLGSVSGILYGATAKNLYIEDNTIGGAGNDGFVVGSVNNTTPSTNVFINSQGIGLRGILVDRGTSYVSPLLVSVKNNTITNLDRLAGTITTYSNQRSAGASAITVYNGATTNIIEGNTISGMDIANGFSASGTNTGLDVIYAYGKPKSGTSTITVKNNSISAISRNQFGFITSMPANSGLNSLTTGIRADYSAAIQNKSISFNTIDGITQIATYATTAAQQNTFNTRVIGIDTRGKDTALDKTEIFDNTISNISGANWSSTGTFSTTAFSNPFSVIGINARNGQFISVYNNSVCGLSTTLSGTTTTTWTASDKGVVGIALGKEGTAAFATKTTLGESIYNNFVSELTAPNISEELAIQGILYWGSGRFARIVHNTIALGDVAGGTSGRLTTTGNTFGVSGLTINNRYFNTTAYPTIVRNNIISINATAKGSTGAALFSTTSTGGFNTAWRTPQTTMKKKPLGIDNSSGGNVYFINDDIRNYIFAQGVTTTQSRYYTSGLRNAFGYYIGAPATYVNTTNNMVNDIVVAGKFFNDTCGKYKSFWGSPEKNSFIDVDSFDTFLPLPFVNSGATCTYKLKIPASAYSYVVTAAKTVGAPLNVTSDKFGTTRNTTLPTAGAHAAPPGATGPPANNIEFNYNPICDGVCLGAKTLNVTITPPDGKTITTNLANAEIPRVYYRRIYNNSAYTSTTTTAVPSTAVVDHNLFYRDGLNTAAGPSGWRFVKASAVNGADYTFEINESILSGSVPANITVPTYTIEYFVIATTTDASVTSWSSGDLSSSCPTSVIMNNATTGTTTIPGPTDEDATPATGLNIATGAIEGNSVADKYTIYKGADLTRNIKVGNNSINYSVSGTTNPTTAEVNIPICTGEKVELEADYLVTASLLELLDECVTYKLQVATNVGFTTGVETFTQVNDPKFTYIMSAPGSKFFRFWIDCGGTNTTLTNTRIIQFTATDCPVNTTPVIDDLEGCVGTAKSVTVTTSTPTVNKFFWVVNPFGKVYANAPTAQTALTRSISFTPTSTDESGIWKTYVTNSTGNSVVNAIIKSADYYDGTLFNTNGGSADVKKGTAFSTTKFIKLNALSLIGATGDASASSGFSIKLYEKSGQLLYTQAGASVADNTAVQIALTNWYIPPGDYVVVLDEATSGTAITGALASLAISGPLSFTNTDTPSIIIQGGVESETDFDNADASIAHYFADWDFTELCTSQEPNRTFNYTIVPATCCSVPVLPSFTVTTSIPAGECGLKTYTVTFNNTSGAAISNLKFQTNLDAGQFLVDASIPNFFGGTIAPDPYADAPNFVIEGMTLPTGISTFTFDVNAVTISLDPKNIFTLENDCVTTKKTVVFPTPSCVVCENGIAKLTTNIAWNNAGSSSKISNAIVNVPLTGNSSEPITADIEVQYPSNVEYDANEFPRSFGEKVQLTRYDDLNGVAGSVIYKVKLKDTNGTAIAARPSFSISGINEVSGQKNSVKIYGNCGAEIIPGKLSNAFTKYPQLNTYEILGNTASGIQYGNASGVYGTVNVEFEKPVIEVYIEWYMDRTPIKLSYSELFISEMNFNCKSQFPELLPDNVYVEASFSKNEVLTCNDARIKLKITNLNCDEVSLSMSNTLPLDLEYVSESLEFNYDSYAAIGNETPVYGGQNFTLPNIDVPSGVSYVYVKVRPINPNASGAYPVFFNYKVSGGVNDPNPYRSDDNSGQEGYQDAIVNYTAVTKPIMPTFVKSVNRCFNPLTGSILTYKLTINSTSPTDLTNVEISDILDKNQNIIPNSLVITGLTGGTANDYNTESNFLTIQGLTIPANVVNATIVFKVDTQDTAEEFVNFAFLTIDPTSECGASNSILSNEVFNTICTYCALDPNTAPATTYSLAGISTQAKRTAWPKDVPNGFLVLESKEKGFVITRLTTAERDALTAVEGMLIYNITNSRMELFNGAEWTPINRGCN